MTAPRTSSAFDTRSLVFWVSAALLVYGLIEFSPIVLRSFTGAFGPALIAATLWTIYTVALLVIISRLAAYEKRSPLSILFAFLWGAIVVSGIAVVAAPAGHTIAAWILGGDSDWVAAIGAPLVEEPLKMLGVVALALIPGARVRSVADGLFYGVIVGLGFEVFESFLYSTQWGTSGTEFGAILAIFIMRGVIGGLWSHPTYTAVTGAGVGYFFSSRSGALKRWAVMIASLIGAMILHGFFDSPLLEGEGSNPAIATVVKGLPILVLGLVVWRVARRRSRVALSAAARDIVPDEYVSPEDFAALATRRSRRQQLKAMRKAHGRRAARALSRVQRAQLDALVNASDDGIDSVRAIKSLEELAESRAALAEVSS